MSFFCLHCCSESCSAYSCQGEILQERNMPPDAHKSPTTISAGPPKSQSQFKSLLLTFYSFACFSHFLLSVFSCASWGKEEFFLDTEICSSHGIFRHIAANEPVHAESPPRADPRPQHILQCLGTCTMVGAWQWKFLFFPAGKQSSYLDWDLTQRWQHLLGCCQKTKGNIFFKKQKAY